MTSKAYELGKQAFQDGQKRVPVHDQKLIQYLEHNPDMSAEILKKWLRGWDDANLKGSSNITEMRKLIETATRFNEGGLYFDTFEEWKEKCEDLGCEIEYGDEGEITATHPSVTHVVGRWDDEYSIGWLDDQALNQFGDKEVLENKYQSPSKDDVEYLILGLRRAAKGNIDPATKQTILDAADALTYFASSQNREPAASRAAAPYDQGSTHFSKASIMKDI